MRCMSLSRWEGFQDTVPAPTADVRPATGVLSCWMEYRPRAHKKELGVDGKDADRDSVVLLSPAQRKISVHQAQQNARFGDFGRIGLELSKSRAQGSPVRPTSWAKPGYPFFRVRRRWFAGLQVAGPPHRSPPDNKDRGSACLHQSGLAGGKAAGVLSGQRHPEEARLLAG